MRSFQDSLFWVQDQTNSIKTYGDFLNFINSDIGVENFYVGKDNSLLYSHFIKSLVHGLDFTFIDPDFSLTELDKLFENGFCPTKKQVPKLNLLNLEDVYDRIQQSTSGIYLFTSGTTGLPKKVKHSIISLSRGIKQGLHHKQDVWGFCYNSTHIAGIQVFLQAFFNQNTIVYLYAMPNDIVKTYLHDYKITHLSATPTFYRLFLIIKETFNLMQRVSVGGEKSDQVLIQKMKEIFPSSKITNIYASTELGSILSSENEVFVIPENYQHLIKIDENQLLIHTSLAASFLQKEKTDWYETGDMIEWVDESKSKFKFISRKGEIINTGGYKVNPGEIEDLLMQHSAIQTAVVYSKHNTILGYIIIAEVKLNEGQKVIEQELKSYLSQYLQSFKIPRMIKIVEHLSVTRTGKINRHKN
jgi:acyl-coenzyme A synthetase/AMP-(fatty) acid ligase